MQHYAHIQPQSTHTFVHLEGPLSELSYPLRFSSFFHWWSRTERFAGVSSTLLRMLVVHQVWWFEPVGLPFWRACQDRFVRGFLLPSHIALRGDLLLGNGSCHMRFGRLVFHGICRGTKVLMLFDKLFWFQVALQSYSHKHTHLQYYSTTTHDAPHKQSTR